MKKEMISVRNKVIIPMAGGINPTFISFNGFATTNQHFAVVFQGTHPTEPPIVRVHSECITGDLFGSLRCDCGKQLEEAIQVLSEKGGLLLYLRQEGRGIGLYAKLDAYTLQDKGLDTFEANHQLAYPADARDYGCAASMLEALGYRSIRLLSNNPDKVGQLQHYGIEVVEQIQTSVFVNKYNLHYLNAKVQKANHLLDIAHKNY